MDKGNKDQHRYSIKGSGLGRVTEQSKWGAEAARARYSRPDASPPPPKDTARPQFKQDQSVKGAGDVADGWLRGKGGSGMGPNFQKSKF
jgi:hypothetical protein